MPGKALAGPTLNQEPPKRHMTWQPLSGLEWREEQSPQKVGVLFQEEVGDKQQVFVAGGKGDGVQQAR